MISKQKVEELSYQQIRNIILATNYWCINNLGVNRRRRNQFSIVIKKQTHLETILFEKFCGQFSPVSNTVEIFYNNNKTVKDLIQTYIHEYTHYLQPVRKYYGKLDKQYGYDNNPFEIEARNNEKEKYRECKRFVDKCLK
jgi:hypothetical protein